MTDTQHPLDQFLTDSSVTVLEPKHRMISEENFILLKLYQEKIFKATEVTPSLKKILNLVINKENLEKISEALIKSLV